MAYILHAQTADWQQELQNAITNVKDLLSYLELKSDTEARNYPEIEACENFPLKVPRSYLSRIPKSDPQHPMLRQILPLSAESRFRPGFSLDSVGDLESVTIPGVLQKYQGRALLIATGACAIHCRYCFRRNFPYQDQSIMSRLSEVLAHLSDDSSIEEVILSGGDPLVLNNRQLFRLCEAIEKLPHIKRIRIHTRLPICIPSRLETEIIGWLNDRSKPYILVFHINHPDEIDAEVKDALKRLDKPQLLNQAVLLKDVNDDVDTLAQLSVRCVDAGILPYYLHLLDLAQGTAHFEVDEEKAKRLILEMRKRLSGYLVPRLARENSGEPSKQVLL